MFSTKGVSETGGKYISYGIKDVKIVGIEAKESDGNSSPSLIINFEEVGTGKTQSSRFTFTEKSTQISLRKIKHILTKVVDETTADSITATTITQYATDLSNVLLSKTIRVKFSGEEVAGKEGKNNWFKAVINFPPFAEPITVNPTNLKFDTNLDIRRLIATTKTPNVAADALPF